MIDIVGSTLAAIARHEPARVPLIFAAGVVTSIGPCIAPRYIAITALVQRRRPLRVIAAFVAGLIGAFLVIGLGAGVLGSLVAQTSVVYLVLAAGLVVTGVVTLLRPNADHDGHAHTERVPSTYGATFLLGAGSAFVVSPCCTPILAAVVAMSAFDHQPTMTAVLLAVFALGHAVPLFFAGTFGAAVTRLLGRVSAGSAPAIVAGTLMLALGCYYGLLA